jgi:hypothetical protein
MVIEVTFDTTDVYISTTVSPVYVNVSFEAPSGGGGAVWGDITGTLSDQTDLQTALDAKVPYTGATQDVSLGEYEIKAGQLTLDTSPTGTAAVGTTRWNDTIGSSETTLKGGNVILKNGVDLVARVVNKVSPNTTLTKAAYQAVRVSGAQGQRLAVALAQANNDNNSADTIGLVTETIATNQEGFIITVGQLENINTTGSLQGETWADGDVLYLSPTTAGALTNVKPNATIGHIVVIGYVEYAHANNGKIYVKVMNGWELGELHDVYVPTPSNNDVLTYETSSGLWKNKSIATALGYTPANAATTLTINGVTYDLSANRSWTVSGGISGSGAAGQVAYWTGTSAQSGSNNLFWDVSNSRLGVGTNTPNSTLSVAGNLNISGGTQDYIFSKRGNVVLTLQSQNSGLLQQTEYYTKDGDGTDDNGFAIFAKGIPSDITNFEQFRYFYSSSLESYIIGTNKAGTGSYRDIRIGNSPTPTDLVIKATTGNVLVNSTSDGGQRLQVQGTTLLNGNVTFSSATGMFWDATNSRLGIGTNAPAVGLDLRNRLRVSGTSGIVGDIGSNTYGLSVQNNASSSWIEILNNGGTSKGVFFGITNDRTANTFELWNYQGGAIDFYNAAFATTGTRKLRIWNNGNVTIQDAGTYTDSGERLQVTGTMKVTGAGTANTTFANAGQSVYNTYAPTGQSSWIIGVETQYFLGYSGRNILVFSRDRNHTTGGIDNNYIGFGHLSPTANVDIASSSTARASLRIRSGTAPTTPNDGDIWFDGTDIKMRIGGVTKTFTLI